ncbi:RsmB/NOP family class I SAM-dependent RNA methyltransferase [Candidatus Woesearchaeota archaeon]|nr:RsmB/NOP family class I SAM-dependent RNA methyltransferase [Candidatus Woesearchaeota archaeon]
MGYFENRYLKICPDFSTEVEERKALRVNTLKIEVSEITKRLEMKEVKIEKIKFLRKGYYYEAEFSLGATPEYLMGYYYLQGAASQLVAEVLDPQQGETVLDMAAAPGSKTTHLAQLMKGTGTIVALDSNVQRLASLRNNCERLMVKNVLMFKKDGRFIADLGMEFDRILLDAPCSGNFCSEEGWFNKRNIEDIKQNGRVQKALLKAAYNVLKKGGTLVYSTCSLEPEEDELVINWFLGKYDDMQLEKLDFELGDEGVVEWENKQLNPELAKTRRFWPHKTNTEGFFVAKLRKK